MWILNENDELINTDMYEAIAYNEHDDGVFAVKVSLNNQTFNSIDVAKNTGEKKGKQIVRAIYNLIKQGFTTFDVGWWLENQRQIAEENNNVDSDRHK